jgi:hypothetical protein
MVRAIVTLIVTVGVIPVGVMTIIIGLTLIVIAVGIIAVGIPWPYGNDNLSFRLRRNQSDKSNDGQDQEEKLFHIVTFCEYYNTEWQVLPDYSKQSESRFCHTRIQP